MMKKPASLFLLSLLVFAGMSFAKEKKIELPQETPSFKPGKGSELMGSYCLTCHSTEYFTTQPPLPRKGWEAIVIKMRDKFGATIPDSSIPEITDYLTENYGAK
jgi:mono/diheme cytochrome c family protein